VGLLPGAGVSWGLAVASIMVPLALILMIAADRDRVRREIVVLLAAREAHLRRQRIVDELLRRAGPDLPALVGSLAVRLRAPLADVSAEIAALQRESSAQFSAHQRSLLSGARTGVRRMQELNERLLDYAVADSVPLRLSDVHLTALAAEAAADRHALSAGQVPRITVSDLPRVRGDVTLLRQVLDDLIKNAVEYAVPGHPARVAITAVAAGPSAYRIEVEDCGIGVPAERRARLFEAFYQAHDGRSPSAGRGLGLAVVQRVVLRHGGTIGVDENPRGGCRFWFTLPVA
jgi:signal transduction histidine kinase